jgi:copper(I)-binding protein
MAKPLAMLLRRRHLLLLSPAWIAAAYAHSARTGAISLGHAWALPASNADGQAFVPLLNTANEADKLVAARSPATASIEFRSNNRYDDPPLTNIELAPGRPVPMRPTALHLRLVGLRRPLVLGERIAIILDFLNAGEIEIEFYIEATPGE